jgi:hypothetical protein
MAAWGALLFVVMWVAAVAVQSCITQEVIIQEGKDNNVDKPTDMTHGLKISGKKK